MRGYPILTEYKYLGLKIDDCLKFDVELSKKKLDELKLKKISYILTNGKLDIANRYAVWHSLFKSKVWYQVVLLSSISEAIRTWANGYIYRSLKQLLNLQGNPNAETVLGIIFGVN